MPTQIDWKKKEQPTSNSNSNKKSKKGVFVKFKSGETVKVRPLGHGQKVFKFFIKENKRSICVSEVDKNEAEGMLSQAFGRTMNAATRYAINVLDRRDNTFKILEGPYSIFKNFFAWAEANDLHPGHPQNGCDWSITAEGEDQQRRYTAVPGMKPTPLTAEEMKRAKENKEVYDLTEHYKDCPLSEIVARATGENRQQAGPDTDMPPPPPVGGSSNSIDF